MPAESVCEFSLCAFAPAVPPNRLLLSKLNKLLASDACALLYVHSYYLHGGNQRT